MWGGMAEVVRDGVDGLHFRAGDAGDLAARIEFLLADRDRVKELQRHVPDVKSIASELEEIGQLYLSCNRKETALPSRYTQEFHTDMSAYPDVCIIVLNWNNAAATGLVLGDLCRPLLIQRTKLCSWTMVLPTTQYRY